VWNNFKFDVLYHHWSGSTRWGLAWTKLVISSLTLGKPMFNFFTMVFWEIDLSFSISSLTFWLFKSWVAVTGLPDCSWSLRSKFPPLFLDFLT
jgi:hypothetical protein